MGTGNDGLLAFRSRVPGTELRPVCARGQDVKPAPDGVHHRGWEHRVAEHPCSPIIPQFADVVTSLLETLASVLHRSQPGSRGTLPVGLFYFGDACPGMGGPGHRVAEHSVRPPQGVARGTQRPGRTRKEVMSAHISLFLATYSI